MLKVAKFGGSSLADARCFLQVRDIVRADPARRVVVVSAPGRRHAADHKVTDLLYLCHAHLEYHVPCWDLFRRIRERFLQIRDGCALQTPIGQALDEIYESLTPATSRDFLASRGEYLAARLMADLLGYEFVDAAGWLRFDYAGNVLTEESFAALHTLADGRKIVTPGFYGVTPGGAVHTFSRGGSDVTGSLAAAALHADVCENWTDVPGVLAADPRLVPQAEPIARLTYAQLQSLSAVGMQVLHESAVEPLRAAGIPLHIRSTHQPEAPGTLIGCPDTGGGTDGAVGFAARRGIAMLRLTPLAPHTAEDVRQTVQQAGVKILHSAEGFEQMTLLLEADAAALHLAAEQLARRLPRTQIKLRENLSLLAALQGGKGALPRVIAAIQDAGVPVHDLAQTDACLLMIVNDSQFETALKAAYEAR